MKKKNQKGDFKIQDPSGLCRNGIEVIRFLKNNWEALCDPPKILKKNKDKCHQHFNQFRAMLCRKYSKEAHHSILLTLRDIWEVVHGKKMKRKLREKCKELRLQPPEPKVTTPYVRQKVVLFCSGLKLKIN